MTPDSKDSLIATKSSEKNILIFPSSETNLEFNFETQTRPRQTDRQSTTKDSRPSSLTSEKVQTPSFYKISGGPAAKINSQTKQCKEPLHSFKKSSEECPIPDLSTNPQTNLTTMSNPMFSQYQQNVQRQSREQRAVGSLLSGLAIVLISSVVLVGGLAAYGGWVLSQQIHKQSVTLSQLESRLTEDIRKLQDGLKETVTVVENLGAQTQAQKQQIGWLQNQAEEIRAQSKKDRANLQKLERKLNDTDKTEALRR